MSRYDRSRSPLGKTAATEHISFTIESFVHFPHTRPEGLRADADGILRLDDLMRTWGRQEGLRSHDVLDAVRRHMFHDTGPLHRILRFTIDTNASGCIVIRVMPERGREHGISDVADCGSRTLAAPAAQPVVRGIRGSVLLERQDASCTKEEIDPDTIDAALVSTVSKARPPVPSAPLQAASAALLAQTQVHRFHTMEMPHSYLERPRPEEREFVALGGDPEAARLRRKTAHGSVGRETTERSGGRRNQRFTERQSSNGEGVQRWLGWVLAQGHRELDVPLDPGGWAGLQDIASAMRQSRPDFGRFGASELQALLEHTDQAGRFEVSGGKLRKVSKGMRQPRVAARASSDHQSSYKDELAMDQEESQWGRGDVDHWDTWAPTLREETAPQSMYGDGPGAQPPPPFPLGRVAQHGTNGPPPPPPGEFWTRYFDEGNAWFFYDGPLGKWWCVSGGEIQRYQES